MTDVRTNAPMYNTPVLDSRGNINEVWWQFFMTLLSRTGGLEGFDIDVLVRRVRSVDALQAATVGVDYPRAELPPVDVSRLGAAPSEAPAPVAIPARAPADLMSLLVANTHGQQQDPGLHALVTPALDGFMSAADKTKLNALAVPIANPATLIADVVLTNTTADGNILALSFPAASLIAGASINLKAFAIVTSAGVSGTLSVWVKIGAVKVITHAFTLPAPGVTNKGILYTATLTVRTAGAAGTVQVSSLMTSDDNSLSGGPVISSAGGAINTTIANTITIGWNWSVANAGNIATAKNASITIEKQ